MGPFYLHQSEAIKCDAGNSSINPTALIRRDRHAFNQY